MSLTVPPGLVLPLRCAPPVVVAAIFTDRELMWVIRSFPNPNRWLSTLMLVGLDTVTLHRPS
ncbi:hypothetical protein [Streptomyces javensis]|uniref:Uncharacterized protein n=1 Tax=Streptomyces javensis TaxID=114698 RepID=A0ABS0RAL0_9ACTN|nr:hypothetical protein [Streptomyces javensis]MBI0314429.1 hypothetical protein [Streptomyces javensis]